MRNLIDIVASPPGLLLEAATGKPLPPLAPGHVRLFRGDNSKVEKFETGRTALSSLFGHGIYLTDNKRVAGDYKTKGAGDGEVLFRLSGRKLTQQAVLDYWLRRQASMMDANGKSDPYGSEVRFSDGGQWGVVTNDLRRRELEARTAFARAKWDKLAKDYEIRVKLDGTGVIQRKSKTSAAALAVFDMPRAYADACLHADGDLDDKIVGLLGWVLRRHGDAGTAREMEAFVKNQEWEGERVSYRSLYTSIGPDSPLSHDADAQAALVDGMLELGYHGIEYIGGISMGGGHKHRAFVFWDEDAIHGFRVA